MSLQSVLLIILPVLTPLVGTSVAAILAQSKWPVWANDLIAWLVLLLFAGGDMWANGQFAGGGLAALIDAEQAITLLSSGWLVKLAPWLTWLTFLQANVFSLIPLFEQELHGGPANPQPVTGAGTRAAVPQPITLPSGSSPMPPRASQPPQ